MSLPDMSDALWDLTDPIKFYIVTKTAVGFEVKETTSGARVFDGCLQPVPTQQLAIKPEGQRDWKYWTLFTTQCLSLDDIVVDLSKRQFRVTQIRDWSGAGYREYELTEQDAGLD